MLIYLDSLHNHHHGLQSMVQKRDNIQWLAVLQGKIPCRCQRLKDSGQTALSWLEGNTNSTTRYKRGMQKTVSEHTTRQTSKQLGYSNITDKVPFLFADNRKLRKGSKNNRKTWKNVACVSPDAGVLFDVPETLVSTGLSWVASLSQSKELNFPLQIQPLRLSSCLC